ncbi:MAG: hypothetical protein WB791_02040 [Waddliaceae bacterium]
MKVHWLVLSAWRVAGMYARMMMSITRSSSDSALSVKATRGEKGISHSRKNDKEILPNFLVKEMVDGNLDKAT